MKKRATLFFAIGFILVIISIWQIYRASSGLEIISLHDTNPPVTIIKPADIMPGTRPTVLIAHGFAGSSILMRGFALTLAHAGYITVSWDTQGHGLNSKPMDLSTQAGDLLQDADTALASVKSTVAIDNQQKAIMGHSMGSGVALNYGLSYPETKATIAISPVNMEINPDLPHNLLLMAGQYEQRFAGNARYLMDLAGGENGDFTSEIARKLVIIPSVEHISILFSPRAHLIARNWLDEVFGPQPGAEPYVDRRILWFGLGILGSIFLGNACLSILPASIQAKQSEKPAWLRIFALVIGGIGGVIILWLIGFSGVELNQLLGLLVGGYLIIWFGVAGILGLFVYRPGISIPTRIDLVKSLLAFVVLWSGVGLLGNFVWLPWLLIPYRLALWIPSSIILLPWFFMIGNVIAHSKPIAQIGWWMFQSVCIITSLFLATRITPQIGFIFIILPLVPVMIGIHQLVISPRHGPWAYSISGAMFTAWLILAVFPLQ